MATADSEKLCFELAAESLGSNTPPLGAKTNDTCPAACGGVFDFLIQRERIPTVKVDYWILLMGPAVATHKFFGTLNRVERRMNEKLR